MKKSFLSLVVGGLVLAILGGVKIEANKPKNSSIAKQQKPAYTCQFNPNSPNFLVFAGGGDRYNNEIALEKNVLYFQRTLKNLGFNPLFASTFFASGNNEEATIRYLDTWGNQQFKAPRIPYLQGAATKGNLQNWFAETADQNVNRPLFFYFTGHGIKNEEDSNNNYLLMWKNKLVSVRQLSQMLDKLPPETPVVTMMAQCFSGSFANIIYRDGDPNKSIALQSRCGFFATIKTLPSVGCTPEVNEADYEDYSSSFFAGLSGINRVGEKVASADYNRDGKVSYAEAHAFAKVDNKTMDLPVSTSEVWLQEMAGENGKQKIWNQGISNLLSTARPEQKYVVNFIVNRFNFDPQKSYLENGNGLREEILENEVEMAYVLRLGMELVNISMEREIRQGFDGNARAILDRLIQCEGGSW
jgi:hypothetical protein